MPWEAAAVAHTTASVIRLEPDGHVLLFTAPSWYGLSAVGEGVNTRVAAESTHQPFGEYCTRGLYVPASEHMHDCRYASTTKRLDPKIQPLSYTPHTVAHWVVLRHGQNRASPTAVALQYPWPPDSCHFGVNPNPKTSLRLTSIIACAAGVQHRI